MHAVQQLKHLDLVCRSPVSIGFYRILLDFIGFCYLAKIQVGPAHLDPCSLPHFYPGRLTRVKSYSEISGQGKKSEKLSKISLENAFVCENLIFSRLRRAILQTH